MIRLYARTLIALGLAGILFASGRIAVVGLSHGASPVQAYYTCPEGGPAHVHGCPYVDWTRTDLIRLPGPKSADKRGLCERCFPTEHQRTASAQSRLPARAETESPPE